MGVSFARLAWCLFLLLLFGSRAALGCELSAGTDVWARLSTPVSSYFSKAGSEVRAVVTEDLQCPEGVVIPAGTLLEGQVRSVKKVGWGVRHEVAALKLQFNRLNLVDGSSLAIESRVVEVENARETLKNGVIIGIRSTDTPQGTINSRLKHLPTWNPYTDAFLFAYKATFPIFPEPEIYYGVGTDLRLELVTAINVAKVSPLHAAATENEALNEMAAEFPRRVFTLDEKDADVVNIAFLGSREEVQQAFQSAGWVGSDKLSKASFLREFHAYLDHSGYATAPMRPMLLDNELPDMLWQKSLNTYSKRDHLRIWQSAQTVNGTSVWIGAATHDNGATLSLRQKRFVHSIDPQIDHERAKIVRDLKMVGCVQAVSMVDRPEMPRYMLNATGDPVRTDAKIAVVELKDCSAPATTAFPKFKPGNVVFRYLRRQILTVRSDIWRANIIYGAYDLARLLRHTAHSLQKPAQIPEDAKHTSPPAQNGNSDQVITGSD